MARTFIIFILMLLSAAIYRPAPARAWELIRARIVSISSSADGIVNLKVTPEKNTDNDDDESKTLEVNIEDRLLATDLKPGDNIRIWRKNDPTGKTLVHISPSRGFDATGVRSRLGGRGRSGRGSRGHGGGGSGGGGH